MRGSWASFRGKFGISKFSVASCAWIWEGMPSGAPGERGESEGSVGNSLKITGLDTSRQPRTKARLSSIHVMSSHWGAA